MINDYNIPVFILHLSTEIKGCNHNLLGSVENLDKSLNNVCTDVNVSVINKISHHFSPNGVSIVYILSASHLALHTWPEQGFAHLDLISCTQNFSVEKFKESVIKNFGTGDIKINQLPY